MEPSSKEASPRKPIGYIPPYEAEYIYFKLKEHKPKTEVYSVLTRSHDELIGEMRYFAKWRQYCFFPIKDTVYSKECLGDLLLFIQDVLEREGKKEGS